jgi:hypothetical protein
MCEVEVGCELGAEEGGDVFPQAVGAVAQVLLAAGLLPWEAVPEDKDITAIRGTPHTMHLEAILAHEQVVQGAISMDDRLQSCFQLGLQLQVPTAGIDSCKRHTSGCL